MAKAPPNLPDRKDRVKLRGRSRRGVLEKLDEDTLWATVKWDDARQPMIVHLWELEREC